MLFSKYSCSGNIFLGWDKKHNFPGFLPIIFQFYLNEDTVKR